MSKGVGVILFSFFVNKNVPFADTFHYIFLAGLANLSVTGKDKVTDSIFAYFSFMGKSLGVKIGFCHYSITFDGSLNLKSTATEL